MFQLFILACAVVHGAFSVEVMIKYVSPVLSFTLPLEEKNIGGVTFNYFVKNVAYRAMGVHTSQGWEYRTREVSLDGADTVYANAEVYGINGNLRLTTVRSSLVLANPGGVARLPSRRLRGATYFRDDFNSFNAGNWDYEVSMYGGYNGEFQVYTNDGKNVYTNGGILYIQPIATTSDSRFNENYLHSGVMDMNQLFGYCTEPALDGCHREGRNGILPPVMSGKLKSKPQMTYGILEIRAKIPKGDWLWPAIWMLPCDDLYGDNPRSGEIDIMESTGNNGAVGVGTVTSTLHWGPSADENRFMKTHGEKTTGSWHDNFHTWRLEWTANHIITFVDNQQIMYVDPGAGGFWSYGGFRGNNIWASGGRMAPFDQCFYLILNVAVGGTSGFFSDEDIYDVHKPWNNDSPDAAEEFWNAHNSWLPTWKGQDAALQVDYVEFQYI